MVLQTKDKEKGVISNSEIQSADSDGVDGGGLGYNPYPRTGIYKGSNIRALNHFSSLYPRFNIMLLNP